MKNPIRLAAALLVFGLVAAACGGDDGGVTVSDAWSRNSAGMQSAGAAYMQIKAGDEADRLMGASVPSSIAAMTQIHQTAMNDGVMSMSEVGEIAIAAGETVALEPGGYHIMMMNLAAPLEVGQKFTVTLTFEKAGTVDVEVEVREG